MTKRISIAVVGNTVEVATVEYLGGSWDAYQTVCAAMNLRWNRARGTLSKNIGAIENLPAIVNGMSTAGFTFDLDEATTAALKKATTSGFTDAESAAKALIEAREVEFAKRGLKLWKPFQQDGAIFLAARDRCLLGDEVGTGKTIQALASWPEKASVVVCCPSSVVVNWARECRRWRPDLHPHVVMKSASARSRASLSTDGIYVINEFYWPAAGNLVIVNWESIPCAADVLDKNGEILVTQSIDSPPTAGTVLFGDEIHRVKSRTAKMTAKWGTLRDAVKEVGGKVYGASGTPIYNRPFDLANVLRALGLFNDVFVSWKDFLKRMGGYEGQYGIVWSGRVDPTVADSMKRVMIRREKEDVLKWLPAKTYRDIEVEPSKALAKLADKAVGDLKEYYEELLDAELENDQDASERLGRIYSKIAFEDMSRIHSEMSAVGYAGAIDLIEDYEESGTPLVVACVHREQVELLGKRKGWATILGGDDLAKRAEVVRRFQAGEIDYIACTIKAGGVGITLNRASHLIMLSQDWSPSENEQMEGRCIAEGQLVLTEAGWTPIEKVSVGDMVVASSGQLCRVTDAWSKLSLVRMVEIDVYGWPVPITTTFDHRLLVLSDGVEKWVEADAVRPGDVLVQPWATMTDKSDLKEVVFDYDCRVANKLDSIGRRQSAGRLAKAPDLVRLDDEALFVMGYFAGDGFSRVSPGSGRFVGFCGNKTTKVSAMKRCAEWARAAGMSVGVTRVDGGGTETRCYSAEWAFWFRRHFGKSAKLKHLPNFFRLLSRRQAKAMLAGLFASDGYLRDARYEYVTSSGRLAAEVASLMLISGGKPCVTKQSSAAGGCWVVASSNGAKWAGLKVLSVKMRNPRQTTVGGKRARERVYDLTVYGEESFVVGTAVVHNCHRGDKKEAVLITRMIPAHPFIRRLLFLLNWKRQIHEDAIGAASIVDSVASERRAQAEEALLAADRARMAVEGEVTRKAAVKDARALLAAIPVGRYAIDAADGSHLTFWELDKPTAGKWKSWAFLKVVAGPNVGRFSTIRPDGLATPAAMSVLERIAKDPLAAGKRYADEVGCCSRCFQTLTNELSRTRGYGETCWAKTNAEIGEGVRA